jgi:uncharacterized membrane protein YqiK
MNQNQNISIEAILAYWWTLIPILSIVFFKPILRVVLGMVLVPEDKIGLVTKKFVLVGSNRGLPDGRILATKGEAGIQARALPPGIYWMMFPWQYSVTMSPFTVIPQGKVGLILANDGHELPVGHILGTKVECDNFQDAVMFLERGGQKGRQTQVLPSGTYRINTLAYTITLHDITIIRERRKPRSSTHRHARRKLLYQSLGDPDRRDSDDGRAHRLCRSRDFLHRRRR